MITPPALPASRQSSGSSGFGCTDLCLSSWLWDGGFSWNNSNISWKVQPSLAALDICLRVCFYTTRVCQPKWKPCSLAAAFINSAAYLLSMFISCVASTHLVEAWTVRGFMCFLGIMGSLLEPWHHVGFPQQTRNPWLECLWVWG